MIISPNSTGHGQHQHLQQQHQHHHQQLQQPTTTARLGTSAKDVTTTAIIAAVGCLLPHIMHEPSPRRFLPRTGPPSNICLVIHGFGHHTPHNVTKPEKPTTKCTEPLWLSSYQRARNPKTIQHRFKWPLTKRINLDCSCGASFRGVPLIKTPGSKGS